VSAPTFPPVPPAPGDAAAGSARDVALQVPPPVVPEHVLSPAQWGMLSFLLSEVAFFSTLIVTYIAFMGKDTSGPTPGRVLTLPLVICTTLCLLASSATVHLAGRSLRSGDEPAFHRWWAATIALGVAFLLGTAYEWHGLIYTEHLTITTNLFGCTYYTLVGFHALHVTIGVIVMTTVLMLAVQHHVTARNPEGVELVSWYWHFVDGVWVVVFTVVYLVSRGV
jgi:cytochrome c oxidase subunit 3/cytochrome o ubiquinol oxidase subunit 3